MPSTAFDDDRGRHFTNEHKLMFTMHIGINMHSLIHGSTTLLLPPEYSWWGWGRLRGLKAEASM